jgi:hypothetical protein
VLASMGQSHTFRLHLVTVPGGLTRSAGASQFTMQPVVTMSDFSILLDLYL